MTQTTQQPARGLITVPDSELPQALMCSDEELADIQEGIALNAENGDMSEYDIPRITVAPGALKINTPSGSVLRDHLYGVAVYIRNVRTYYKSKAAGNKPPDCYSKDRTTGIGDPGGKCKECPFAQYESATTADGQQGKGQACKESKQIFILTGGPGMPRMLSIPPTSLGVAKDFFAGLNFSRPYYKVLIRVTVQNAKNGLGQEYGTAVFEEVRTLTPAEVKRALMFRGAVETFLKAAANEPLQADPQQDGE